MIFDTTDAFLASSPPFPPCIRKSRYHDQIITVTTNLTKIPGFSPLCPPTRSCVLGWSKDVSLHATAKSDSRQTFLAHNLARRRNRALFLASAGNLLGKTIFPTPHPLQKHSAEYPLTYHYSFTFWAYPGSPRFIALILNFGTLAQMMKECLEREAFMHLQFQGKYLSSHPREWQNSVMTGVQ